MSNRLTWMKHYHYARNDDFIKRAEDRFGHFGYSAYFKMLEVLHEHGSGDKLCITRSRLSSELRSRWPQVQQYLDFCRTSGKVQVSEVGQELILDVKNFRKMQLNKSRKNTNVCFSNDGKNTIEGDGEEEGDNSIRKVVSSLVKRVFYKREPWTDFDLENHKLPIQGKDKDIRIIDLEPSRCAWYLERIQTDNKTTAALKHRIALKAGESNAR